MTRRHSSRQVEAQRRFLCDRCNAPVVICARCDCGQRYCGPACALAARRENQRASNRRYQATERGRELHRARQAAYRDQLHRPSSGPLVTEQGRPRADSEPIEPSKTPARGRCPVCGAPQTPFLRLGPKFRPGKRLRRPARRRGTVHPQTVPHPNRALDRQNPALCRGPDYVEWPSGSAC
jgi:hypothetical protein